MANLGTLMSVTEPSGFWVNIIKAFEGWTLNYVLAIILLTVVIRLIWAVVETFSKFTQQKQAGVQAKMQPELEKLKAKYASQPQVLSQKQNELYRKYYGKGYYGSCAIMLVVMALNMVVFFTLFAGLNSMASYRSTNSYDSLKYEYANCLNVTNEYLGDLSDAAKNEKFADYENLEFRVSTNTEDGKKYIGLYQNDELLSSLVEYKNDFSSETTVHNTETDQDETVVVSANSNIIEIMNKLFPAEGSPEISEGLTLSEGIQKVVDKAIVSYYDENKDSFLWIENIWLADSPLVKSIPSYSSISKQLGKNYVQEGEETIYNGFMTNLSSARNRANGYFILPILCILAAFLSIQVNALYNKIKNKKKGIIMPPTKFKWTTLIIPMILGLFALLYNSVFAIYLLTGQLVSTLVSPLQLLIIDKIIDKKKQKEEDAIVVDYSRKF
jgi:membrane protein insertase Oxa1/YidC/SpoIIIJ